MYCTWTKLLFSNSPAKRAALTNSAGVPTGASVRLSPAQKSTARAKSTLSSPARKWAPPTRVTDPAREAGGQTSVGDDEADADANVVKNADKSGSTIMAVSVETSSSLERTSTVIVFSFGPRSSSLLHSFQIANCFSKLGLQQLLLAHESHTCHYAPG